MNLKVSLVYRALRESHSLNLCSKLHKEMAQEYGCNKSLRYRINQVVSLYNRYRGQIDCFEIIGRIVYDSNHKYKLFEAGKKLHQYIYEE